MTVFKIVRKHPEQVETQIGSAKVRPVMYASDKAEGEELTVSAFLPVWFSSVIQCFWEHNGGKMGKEGVGRVGGGVPFHFRLHLFRV